MTRILFLTTLNLATNPRLVKEIDLAVEMGFDVQVLCFQFDNWSSPIHDQIKCKYPNVDFCEIPAGRKHLIPWLRSVFLEKLARILALLGIQNHMVLSIAVSRRSILLLQNSTRLKHADWVIGHNPGALFPAFVIGKRMKAKIGFDIEDYHPGEGSSPLLKKITTELFNHILSKLDYISVASPLFIEPLERLTKQKLLESVVVLNTFPLEEFTQIAPNNPAKLQMVWYSQNITLGRGLENILPALKKYADQLELHLIGQPDQNFKRVFLDGEAWINVHGTMTQNSLNKFLATMDVGLSSDQLVDQNRQIAIPNKVISYLQAGLFVLASQTQGHNFILNDQKHRSLIYQNSAEDFDRVVQKMIENKQTIKQRHRNMIPPYFEYWEQSRLVLKKHWQTVDA